MPAATPLNTTFGYAAEERLPRPGIGVPFDRTRASESTEDPGQECKRRNDQNASSSRTATSIIAKAAMRCGPDGVTTRSCAIAPAHRCNGERGIPGYPSKRPRDSLGPYVRVEQQHLTIGPPAGRALPLSWRRHLGAYGLRLRNARERTTRRALPQIRPHQ
jgi:hypothetical protein